MNNSVPLGSTHSRYNYLKKKTTHYKVEEDSVTIWNNSKWEPYKGTTKGLKPIIETANPGAGLGLDYEPLHTTLMEDVKEFIPETVLRSLVSHYRIADMVELEINVVTSHTITG